MSDTLTRLAEVLEARKGAAPESSYVASLYHKGLNKILEKVGEESAETETKPGKTRRNRVPARVRIKQLTDQKKVVSEDLIKERKKSADLKAELEKAQQSKPENDTSVDESAESGKPKQEDYETYDEASDVIITKVTNGALHWETSDTISVIDDIDATPQTFTEKPCKVIVTMRLDRIIEIVEYQI